MKRIFILMISILVFSCNLGAKGKERSFEDIQGFLEKNGMISVPDFSKDLDIQNLGLKVDIFASGLLEDKEFKSKLENQSQKEEYLLMPFIFFKEDNIFNAQKSIDWKNKRVSILNIEDNLPLLVIALFPISENKKKSYSVVSYISFEYFDKFSCDKKEGWDEIRDSCPIEKWISYFDEYKLSFTNIGEASMAVGAKSLANNLNKLLDSSLSIGYKIHFLNTKEYDHSGLSSTNRQILQDTIKVYLELLKYVGK